MAEKIKTITDKHESDHRYSRLESPSENHHESKTSSLERGPDEKLTKTVNEAVDDAKKLAEQATEGREAEKVIESPAQKRHGSPSKRQRSMAFKETMKEVRQEMNLASRITSGIIHNRAVETTSDFIASTIARPNALLSGSVAAFLSVTLLYFFAKNYGYQLSGFETIGAFALGWLLGILYDYISIGLRNKR